MEDLWEAHAMALFLPKLTRIMRACDMLTSILGLRSAVRAEAG